MNRTKRLWFPDAHGNSILYAHEADLLSLPWEHLITASRRSVSGIASRPGGHTTWCAQLGQKRLALITWEWTFVERDTVAFADILAIQANVYPTCPDGMALSSHERRRTLAKIASDLNWVSQVQVHLRHGESQLI